MLSISNTDCDQIRPEILSHSFLGGALRQEVDKAHYSYFTFHSDSDMLLDLITVLDAWVTMLATFTK